MYPVIVIVGPTASGKSDLALAVAERFQGELVNYDSVQVFRGFDIGSAKPSPTEQDRVRHHLIDIRGPVELFTAGDYQREGRVVLNDIRNRGKLPVLVGGTGLYLRALTEGLFQGPTRSAYWRERMEDLAERRGREYLHRLLQRLDPEAANRIAARDKPKVIRALEVRLETGRALSEHLSAKPRHPLVGFRLGTVGLDPPREECYRRIDDRVRLMFEKGLIEEVRGLLAAGVPKDAKPFTALGYRHVLANLAGGEPWETTIAMIQRDTRRYAKRQLTWFRKQAGATWFSGTGETPNTQDAVLRWVEAFLSA
jgi:tRNA dimethylallyltransferase